MRKNLDSMAGRKQTANKDPLASAMLSIAESVNRELDEGSLAEIAFEAKARAMWQRYQREKASNLGVAANGALANLAEEEFRVQRVEQVVLWTRRLQWAMAGAGLLALRLWFGWGGDGFSGSAEAMGDGAKWLALSPLSTLLLVTASGVGLLLVRLQEEWREI